MTLGEREPRRRFRVHAYVCGKACHHLGTIEGWALFGDIFAQRPDGCRYGVVEGALGTFEVWDFYLEDIVTGAFRKVPPDPVWVGQSADELIMKAQALYDRP